MKSEKQVLLIEDNPNYRDLILDLFRKIQPTLLLSAAKDGLEAIDILSGKCIRKEPFCPDLILLDLHLPKKTGFEVLSIIRSDPRLRSIPVVILTSSTSESDIQKSYNLFANCYLAKPIDLASFEEIIQSIYRFWLKETKLPQLNKTSTFSPLEAFP